MTQFPIRNVYKDMMEKNGAIEEFRIDMTNAKTLDKLVGMALK